MIRKTLWQNKWDNAFEKRLREIIRVFSPHSVNISKDDSMTDVWPAHLAAMEGHLSCVKFLIGEGRNSLHILGARNNNGDTPKMLAHQFYKTKVVEYITNIEWERDHPEEAQSKNHA